ncbi:BLUF domain-containing protein [Nitrogeniibacter aestuarii]|uniref:BLUF domain-containing protein n=1 Tax=Nitrogeniibacter aestuarii TaxID=2815343 RepID=UPI001D124B3A|nr:BLUF domain-containing protein [Nitrogeniibacter aestuarii]
MELIQLVYISRATRAMAADDLLALLEVSRRRNKREGITGLLVYHGETFMQVLEGDEPRVGALYEDIVRDPRNSQNHLLYESKIAVREFATWAMAFVPPEAIDPNQLVAFSPFLDPSKDTAALADRRATAHRFMVALRDDMLRRPGHA